ncbi:MAG: glycosyltransferase [Thioploca sp.]|nr:glycosyltransferase [Thioploca sp.]
MKILFHIYGLGAGGAERQLTYLVKGLHERGLEPHILVLSEGGPFWEELKAWGKCPLISLNWRGKMDFSVIFKMARYVRENQIDLIQGWLSPTNSYAAIAAMLTKRVAVMGIRNSKEEEEYGFGPWLYVRIDKIFAHFPVVKTVVCNSYQGQKYYLHLGYPQKNYMLFPMAFLFPLG